MRLVGSRFIVLTVLAMCISAPCKSEPIGVFSWTGDEVFGPVFTIENISHEALSLGPPGAVFFDVVVDLTFGDGTEPQSIRLANIAAPEDLTIDPGEIAQSTVFPASVDIQTARLRLALTLQGILTLRSNATPIDELTVPGTAIIDFTPVPEPPLWPIGGVVLAARRAVRNRPS